MGAGVNWKQAYEAVDLVNHTIVGAMGPAGTVGAAAGWQLGTGHSVISPFFGLGVDNSLEFTVVLPNGTIATVNEYLMPDLFWAIRGGGGPSFGIVVDTTVKTHEGVPLTGAFFVGVADDDESYVSLVTTWMKYHNAVSDAGWGGVWREFFIIFMALTSEILNLFRIPSAKTKSPGGKFRAFFREFIIFSSCKGEDIM
jgi:FAD/FMN-containing dehydrogenase